MKMEDLTMQNKAVLIKWITVAILGLSLVLFFLPYVTFLGESFNPVQMINFYNENQIRRDGVFEVTFGFVVPMVLTALSALLMALKIGTAKCVIAVILNGLAVGVYLLFFNMTYLDINSDNIGFGLVGNIIIACLGVVLPIIVIVFHKAANKKS
jgi:hypothetical protein